MIDITQWSRIGADDFESMQFDSGMIVKNFDPTSSARPADADIICTTSGDITVTCKPNIVDLGEDVNNLHGVFKELQYISKYDVSIQFTALNLTPDVIKMALGAATIDSSKITPKFGLTTSGDTTDFTDITWVGRRIDGGLVAATIKNAFSTDGLSIKASKEGKGNTSVTLTGFMSMDAQGTIPIEFYSIASTGSSLVEITVTSAAGSSSGKTAITMTGFTPSSGDSYVYKTDSSTAPTINYGEVPNYSWTPWNGSSNITATNGHKIAIVAVSSTGLAKAYGSTTVVSNTGA